MADIVHATGCRCCDAAQVEHRLQLIFTQERDDGGQTIVHRCVSCHSVQVEIQPAHGKPTSRWIAQCAADLTRRPQRPNPQNGRSR